MEHHQKIMFEYIYEIYSFWVKNSTLFFNVEYMPQIVGEDLLHHENNF